MNIKSIEEIKMNAQINALKDAIKELRHGINSLLVGKVNDGKFRNLKESISDSRKLLDEMEKIFDALKEIEPENE